MKRPGLIILLLVVVWGSSGAGISRNGASDELVLIPWPVHVERGPGIFSMRHDMNMTLPKDASPEFFSTGHIVSKKVYERTGIKLELDSSKGACQAQVKVKIDMPDDELKSHGPEAYRLQVGPEIIITASDAHGLFNAGMTLLQLIEKRGEEWVVPQVEILDYPRFPHRGLLLDPARRFDTMDEIKRYVDLISELKMNVFHFHLTDDQGFRLESKRFPRLHRVGGTDGYYTEDEIRGLLEFAGARHVMVIPEIDMPGHCRAMLAAYPELSCSGQEVDVAWWTYWIYKTTLCPCNEDVYGFLEKLLGEVASLFPSQYIHIGNDEVAPEDWLDYPGCQELMKRERLEGIEGLQAYFVARVNEILTKHGKGMIAWDETVDYAPEGTIIQSWHGKAPAGQAARAGNPGIVSPFTPWYLSYPWWMWSMKDAYLYEPMPEGLSAEEENLIMGGEACMWQPFREGKWLDTGLFPRILAVAEVLWSPRDARKFKRFKKRVGKYRPILKQKGVKIREWQL
jgi:hexosaminidase